MNFFRGVRVGRAVKLEFIIYFFVKLIPGVSTFLSVFLLVRWLPSEDYGIYSLASVMCLSVSAYIGMWFKQGILRYQYDQNSLDDRKIFSFFLYVVFIGAGFCGCLAYWVVELGSLGSLACAIVCLSWAIQGTVYSIWQVSFQAKKILVAETIRAALMLLGLVCLEYESKLSIELALFILGASVLIPICLPLFNLLRTMVFGVWGPEVRRYLVFGIPLSVWVGLQSSIFFVDKIIVNYYLGGQVLSTYASISDLGVKSFSLIFTPLLMQMHPRIVMSYKKLGLDGARRMLVWVIAFQLFVTFFGLVILSFVDDFLLVKVLSIEGTQYQLLLLSCVLSGSLWQCVLLANKGFELQENTTEMLGLLCVCYIIFLALSLALIGKIGFFAITGASTISAIIYITFALFRFG